jgi:hypothetical protein
MAISKNFFLKFLSFFYYYRRTIGGAPAVREAAIFAWPEPGRPLAPVNQICGTLVVFWHHRRPYIVLCWR